MENELEKTNKSKFLGMWGLILGGAISLWKCVPILILPEIKGNIISGLIFYIILAGILFIALKRYRDNYFGGYIKFGKLFNCGFIITLFSSIVVMFVTFILFSMIIPQDVLLAQQEIAYRAVEPMINEQNESMMEMMFKMMINPYFITMSNTLSFIIDSTIVSLIIAAIMKRNNPNPFANIE